MTGVHPLTTDPKYKLKFFSFCHGTVILLWGLYLYTHIYEIFLGLFTIQVAIGMIVAFDAARRLEHSLTKWWTSVILFAVAKSMWEVERSRFHSGTCEAPGTLLLHPLWHIGAALANGCGMKNAADLILVAHEKSLKAKG
jgi:signal transduction histidine kinase